MLGQVCTVRWRATVIDPGNNTEAFAILLLRLSTGRAQGRSHRVRPGMEVLEARELLSRAQTSISGALSAAGGEGAVASRPALPLHQSIDRRPSIETAVGGTVNHTPRFYELYKGPKQPDLHVLNAHARFYSPGGFVFSGETVGAINSSQTQFYVFGVNRGGATAPGIFPDRPMIVFDAAVVVATSPNGFTSATVDLLNSKGQVTSSTSLATTAITIRNNRVQVVVPASDLPSTTPPGIPQPQDRYSFAFWAGKSASVPNRIASFAPESADTGIPVVVMSGSTSGSDLAIEYG
jgi:hypothetical protein